MAEPELKPRPFCGEEPKLIEYVNCGIHIWARTSKKGIADGWNRRAPQE